MPHTEDHVDGSIKKETVLHVLRVNGVSIVYQGSQIVLSKGNNIEVQTFSDYIHRRMIHRLANKFEIEIHYFYHPDALTQS